MQTWQLKRLNNSCVQVNNDIGVDVKLFANDSVFIENDSFQELFEFLDVQRAINDIHSSNSNFLESSSGINRVVLTSDFHKGSGIPIGTVVEANGFVIPKAIGNDICCGMRLLVTDLPVEKLEGHWDALQKRLRELFFQGQRNIPMSPRQREAVLRAGLPGLLATISDNINAGIYKNYDIQSQTDDLNRIYNHGGFKTNQMFGFEKFITSSGAIDSRDPQIGDLGSNNHFCEFQKIDDILCGQSASRFGLIKGNLSIMVHSGSRGLGYAVGGYFIERAKELFPKGIKHPKNDFYMLPMSGSMKHEGERYMDAMYNAANFAFANRLFLGLMALQAIKDVLKIDIYSKLVYDAPHNLVFQNGCTCLHRKGSMPAQGPSSSDEWLGKPVIIPGSMGSASYLLYGNGHTDSMESAPHGAGRVMARGIASHMDDKIYDQQTEKLRIVNPIDFKSPQLQTRKDILQKYKERAKEEAPYAYKDITPIINSVTDAGIANVVAKLMPLCTVKG